jgi:hypothetical protein
MNRCFLNYLKIRKENFLLFRKFTRLKHTFHVNENEIYVDIICAHPRNGIFDKKRIVNYYNKRLSDHITKYENLYPILFDEISNMDEHYEVYRDLMEITIFRSIVGEISSRVNKISVENPRTRREKKLNKLLSQ